MSPFCWYQCDPWSCTKSRPHDTQRNLYTWWVLSDAKILLLLMLLSLQYIPWCYNCEKLDGACVQIETYIDVLMGQLDLLLSQFPEAPKCWCSIAKVHSVTCVCDGMGVIVFDYVTSWNFIFVFGRDCVSTLPQWLDLSFMKASLVFCPRRARLRPSRITIFHKLMMQAL